MHSNHAENHAENHAGNHTENYVFITETQIKIIPQL